MKIHIGSDHAGFEMKKKLVAFLQDMNFQVVDHGADRLVPDDDYPDYIAPVAEAVSLDLESRGIVLGGSGQGEAIVANKFPGIRCVVFNGQYKPEDGRFVPEEIMITRQHNDANILSLGARFLSDDEAQRAVRLWLNTGFSEDERHLRRIEKIKNIEKKLCQK